MNGDGRRRTMLRPFFDDFNPQLFSLIHFYFFDLFSLVEDKN